VKYVKVNPFIRVFDGLRDEKLDIIFDQKQWVEVKEADWKRLKESETKQGNVLLPTFVEKSEGMGEIKNFVAAEKVEAKSNDDEWYEEPADAEVEEE
tara:strand:- start:1975 stop:2265 length:291 start_codon:yes stop_codon:yes gene_type:complete